MMHAKGLSLLALTALTALASIGAGYSSPQTNTTWILTCGDPGRDGELKTTVTFKYTDANGVSQEHAVSATVSLTANDTSDTKKTKVQGALDTELGKPENQPTGGALGTTSGSGGVITVTPAAGTSIDSLETTDKKTGEKDRITKPGAKSGLAEIALPGELLGTTTSGTPSVFTVLTNKGEASVTLAPGMSKNQLLKNLKTALLALDPQARILIDLGKKSLYIVLTEGDEGICDVGAGTTDQDLAAYCKVMITD